MRKTASCWQIAALGGSLFALAGAMAPATSFAQEAEGDGADGGAGDGEIIVTAQKRSQSLQDVPISIAVVSGTQMSENASATFQDIAPTIPNFSVTKTPAANVIVMRGIGSSPGSPSLEQSVVVFVDGIYGGNTRQFNSPFLDLERIEILRGPQGALVGKNTSAGAINIITRRPGRDFEGYANVDYDLTFDGPTFEGGVNVPISDDLSIRAVGKYSNVDGYMHNTVTDTDQPATREISARLSALYDKGDLKVFAKYEHNDLNVSGSPVQLYSIIGNRPLDWTKETLSSDRPERDDLVVDNAVFQVDLGLGDFTLTSISGYSGFKNRNHVDSDFTPLNVAVADFDQDFSQYSQEIRLLSPTGGFVEYSLGALWQRGKLDEERTTGVLSTPSASTFRSFEQTTRDISIYGQAVLNFTPELALQGSLRYTNSKKNARYRRYQGPQAYLTRTGTLVRDFGGSLSENPVDPSVSLQYRPTRNAMLYASYQRGSKSGGFQGAIGNAEAFAFEIGPESSESYEIGTKFNFPGTGYLNIAAFHTTYKDLQVSTPIPSPDGLSTPFFTGNAGDARVVGVEVDGLLRVAPGFEIVANGAWNPTAKYLTYPSGPCALGQTPNGARPGSCVMTGVRLPYTPRFSGSITPRFETGVGGGLKISANATLTYQSAARRTDAADPLAIQSKWAKIDARLGLGAIDDRWEVAIIGRNLTDKLTQTYGGAGGIRTVADARNVVVAPPRSVLLSLRTRF